MHIHLKWGKDRLENSTGWVMMIEVHSNIFLKEFSLFWKCSYNMCWMWVLNFNLLSMCIHKNFLLSFNLCVIYLSLQLSIFSFIPKYNVKGLISIEYEFVSYHPSTMDIFMNLSLTLLLRTMDPYLRWPKLSSANRIGLSSW